ncbi:MAG: glycosyltransferase [Ignavibacteriae bacterium]|nr:glycosyltransferase [Ignavibacteria bacterium]MBI3364695.1 glycosyltransferase [Ignavibacteriota bacterium]
MQLSVIIINYNVRAFLESALVAVRKAMSGLEGEIFVVDNNSDDGSVEMVRHKFPDVHLIVNERNLGFAAANNIALRRCTGKYILLLNPDTLVQEDTFRVVADFMDKHPEVGLAGCKILNPDGTLQLPCRRSFPTPWVAFTKIIGLSALFPRSSLFGKYNLTYCSPDQSYEVDAVSGSFMFLRHETYQAVGGLDEQFFMYGEDLDWCYRIKSAGRKVYYVHSTQIIHYKGQSARRSDIDEIKLFYQAMRVFVEKHFQYGFVFDVIIRFGIALRQLVAFIAKIAKPLRATALDFLLINLSWILGEWIWFGKIFRFPAYAYPALITVPWLVLASVMYWSGVYSTRKLSISRAATSVIIGYVVLSALTFFFKQYGFSRMVVLISGSVNFVLLPGWRLVARAVLRSPEHRRKSLFGRRTIIVGTNISGQEVLRKLRARIDDGYEVVGFIDNDRKRVGEKMAGVEILGSIDNIGKVIEEQRASEVIFSTDTLSYTDILSVISRSRNRSVNYRLVPSSLEVIIGKTHIDELEDMPLVEIEYNINRFTNRFAKRVVDIAGSLVLMTFAYPIIALEKRTGSTIGSLGQKILLVPKVLKGETSLVGPPMYSHDATKNGSVESSLYLGKQGLTGLVQVNYRDDLQPEEIEKYNLYYAKNQSLLLDLEILIKSSIVLMKR